MEKLGWIPISDRMKLTTLKLALKRIYDNTLPSYLELDRKVPVRNLRNSNDVAVVIPKYSNTFADHAANLFNALPDAIREEQDRLKYAEACRSFLFSNSYAKLP